MDTEALFQRYLAMSQKKQEEVFPRLFGWFQSMYTHEYSSKAEKKNAEVFFNEVEGLLKRMEAEK